LGTAAEHASLAVPVAATDDRVEEVVAGLRGRRFQSAAVVAVCDDRRLAGLVSIERLLSAPVHTRLGDVMDPRPPIVAPGTDQEYAAWRAVQHQEPALAVVDSEGRFLGVIRLLAILLQEHDEDVARLGGFLGSAASARDASTEAISRRLWHRAPWLLVGLAGALLAAVIVGSYARVLEQQVLIAFFVPGVVYIADAVGTQTEALIIRGLSVGVSVARIAVREILTGVALGLLLAALTYPLVWSIWHESDVALAVALALFAASSIATVVAMALPWAFHRLGRDPAFGSGPLATVVQDLLSVIIYFGTAWLIVL
jgi:magnesium transporter